MLHSKSQVRQLCQAQRARTGLRLAVCPRSTVKVYAAASAPSFWERISSAFAPKANPEDAERKRLRQVSLELRELITAEEAVVDLPRVNELLDELIAGGDAGLPFDEAAIGGGPWVVRFTRGKPFLWDLTWNTSKIANSRNQASQDFNPAAGRTALNKVELNGPESFISAAGTYEPVDDSAVTPKTIRANIRSGRLVVWGLDLPLPIAGSGLFEVVYVDEQVGLRVFRSSGRYAVQVRPQE
ncbi:hypothetical protein CHLRE_12g513700v5 [Chlamydomonas reinhardtii]|uniref:Plastid lipid-associated protein/fibrillin conserved domain-containing protein n=1 Tax=Chlamydomonas reinhardtii TaxID=3055 RepID=A0A2K3D3L9_CHLRE|nr:uncharacterized protein CHLRE_12g513700v5 [Chlamydomonas reinhardtii]PNW75126.1 hypothetical protein CHLRE_12g513700v5 [Chlamydomonas reinhardtii]